jgi:hypothetical protein
MNELHLSEMTELNKTTTEEMGLILQNVLTEKNIYNVTIETEYYQQAVESPFKPIEDNKIKIISTPDTIFEFNGRDISKLGVIGYRVAHSDDKRKRDFSPVIIFFKEGGEIHSSIQISPNDTPERIKRRISNALPLKAKQRVDPGTVQTLKRFLKILDKTPDA